MTGQEVCIRDVLVSLLAAFRTSKSWDLKISWNMWNRETVKPVRVWSYLFTTSPVHAALAQRASLSELIPSDLLKLDIIWCHLLLLLMLDQTVALKKKADFCGTPVLYVDCLCVCVFTSRLFKIFFNYVLFFLWHGRCWTTSTLGCWWSWWESHGRAWHRRWVGVWRWPLGCVSLITWDLRPLVIDPLDDSEFDHVSKICW